MTTTTGAFASTLIETSQRAWVNNCAWRMGDTRPAVGGAPSAGGAHGWHGHFENLLQHLSAALRFDAPELFVQQCVWLRVSFESHGLDPTLLTASLEALRDELHDKLPSGVRDLVVAVVAEGLHEARLPQPAQGVGLAGNDSHTALAREYLLAALEGRRDDAIALVMNALERGASVEQITRDVLGRVQRELGSMWHRSQLSIVEEHLVSRTTEAVLTSIRSRLPRAASNGLKVLITSVDGDLHDIGLRVVADHFEMAGWTPIYLGPSTPPSETALAAAEFEVQVVAVGAKLVTHLAAAAEVVTQLRADERTRSTPVIFGGRPFDLAPNLWRALKANGAASSAAEAVALAQRLVASQR
jgi:methanogenic corrinoid protein MtbC1